MFYLTFNYPKFDLKSYNDLIEFLKWSLRKFNSRSFNFDWNTKRPHVSTVSKFKVLTLTGIPKDRTLLRYPNLKFTLKNIQNKNI